MPSLYIVATPIGNLEDITLRALKILNEVDLIAAEDTRVTRKLLTRHKISTPLTSYHEHNKNTKTAAIIDMLTEKNIALVSDAGTPSINDPGQELVEAALKSGFHVTPIPGSSAITAAMSVSGISTNGLVYLGFLPRKKSERRKFLGSKTYEENALLAFEVPHRLISSLSDMMDIFGNRRITVCRELTKLHEEIFHGHISEALKKFTTPKGEFTLVIEGCSKTSVEEEAILTVQKKMAQEILLQLRVQGISSKDAIKRVVEISQLPKRDVYRLWLETR